MKTYIVSVTLAALGAVSFGGCSTQQALDQANHGAALTAALHQQLRIFREQQVMIATSRTETIRDVERQIADFQTSTAFDDRVARAAGGSSVSDSEVYQKILSLTDSIATDDAAQHKRLAELKQKLDELLQPLPDSAAKLAALQKAMAALGAALSPAARLKLVTDFASEVKTDLEKSKEAAAKATKKDSGASTSGSPE